jgi:hypothetical protein
MESSSDRRDRHLRSRKRTKAFISNQPSLFCSIRSSRPFLQHQCQDVVVPPRCRFFLRREASIEAFPVWLTRVPFSCCQTSVDVCDLSSKAGRCRQVHARAYFHELSVIHRKLYCYLKIETRDVDGRRCLICRIIRCRIMVYQSHDPSFAKQRLASHRIASTSLEVGFYCPVLDSVNNQLEDQIRTLDLHVQLKVQVRELLTFARRQSGEQALRHRG